eukprot:2094866-Amphidinium_carterae.2
MILHSSNLSQAPWCKLCHIVFAVRGGCDGMARAARPALTTLMLCDSKNSKKSSKGRVTRDKGGAELVIKDAALPETLFSSEPMQNFTTCALPSNAFAAFAEPCIPLLVVRSLVLGIPVRSP